MSRVLRGFAYSWATLVFIFMTLVWLMMYLRAPSLWEFLKQFQRMVVPFSGESMGYYFMGFILLSPALPLHVAADRLDKGQTTKTRAALYAVGAAVLAVAVVAFVAFIVNAQRRGLL